MLQCISNCPLFTEVKATGSKHSMFKENPWSHMSPYRVRATLRGTPYTIGLTDEHDAKWPSSSGARIFVMGAAGDIGRVLMTVASVFIEDDFDRGCFKVKLADGAVREWGAAPGHEAQAMHRSLGLAASGSQSEQGA